MGKLLNVLCLPFPFIRNPYVPDSFLRLDAFQRQFTIICSGVMRLPEEAPRVGYYQVTGAYEVGHAGLIEDAIVLCTSRFEELHAYPKLSAAESFDPRTVEVYYTRSEACIRGALICESADVQRVLSGVVGPSEIVWRRPCRTDEEERAFEERIEALLAQANEDMRSDSYDSASFARRKARELKGFLVSPRWRAFALKALDDTGVTCCTY
ncbi:hypothetical protein NTD90_14230 [Pseudomonas sp. 20S_6.2_Bac1]|uniref:hypothetical protein n=2 Tax=unclassified Pseudomonas TaxID=196821 RepID=UPI0021C83C62|nr:hypothetical protein [Pseudomonas sp. 20S_6.2_Bac1]MCU1738503.1 hypothetical protein [Pseudomonas sp. 20S_6.2_Bac1]